MKRIAIGWMLLIVSAGFSRADDALPPALQGVGIDQRLDSQVPLDLVFRDEHDRPITLQECVGGKPTILVLAYYRCPMLCTQVLNGVLEALEKQPYSIGKEFNVITASFDAREKPPLAGGKKANYVWQYGRPGAAEGWHFLTGTQDSIDRLTQAVGFHYRYDTKTEQFAHASGIMLLTPSGRISRYFYGIRYSPRDLRLGLVEASAGKIGSPVDRILLFCYHYDESTGKYTPTVMNFVRAGGALTLLTLGAFLTISWRREKRGRSSLPKSSVPIAPLIAGVPLFPAQASMVASRVDYLFFFMIAVTGAVTLVVTLLIVYFAIKYRRRPGVTPATPRITGSMKLELTWTIAPLFVFVAMFLWGSWIYTAVATPPPDAAEVYVVGKQWMWKIQHPDGQREINELHLPVGRPVKLTLTSEDVIHDFFVPAFRQKLDVIPGRYVSTWFLPTKTGRFHLFCAQYCGTNHAGMVGSVIVTDPAEYTAWQTAHAEGSLALAGRKLFLKLQCVTCHSADAHARAPVLEELYGQRVVLRDGRSVVADEAYLRESILNPPAKVVQGWDPIMPTFQGQVSEEDLIALIAYIKSLRRGQTPLRTESFPAPVGAPTVLPATGK